MRFLCTHWPWWLVVGLLAAGLARVRLDVEVLNLLPADLPAVRGLKIYQGHLANGRELLVTVRGPDAEETERAARAVAEALRARRELVSSVVWQPWWQAGPGRAAEWLAFLWLNQPPEVVAGLTNRLAGTNVVGTLARTREVLGTSLSPLEIARLSYDPLDLAGVPQGAMLAAGGGGRGTDFLRRRTERFGCCSWRRRRGWRVIASVRRGWGRSGKWRRVRELGRWSWGSRGGRLLWRRLQRGWRGTCGRVWRGRVCWWRRCSGWRTGGGCRCCGCWLCWG